MSNGLLGRIVTAGSASTASPKMQAIAVRNAGRTATGRVSVTDPAASAYDSVYNNQAAAINKSLSDYYANMQTQMQQASNELANNTDDTNRAYTTTFQNLADNYADRGMLNSGLYASDYDTTQGNKQRALTALQQQWQNTQNQLQSGYSAFQDSEAEALNQAKSDALARAAAKIGITS